MDKKSVLIVVILASFAVTASEAVPHHFFAVPKHYFIHHHPINNLTSPIHAHNLIVGSRVPGDHLVCKEHVVKTSFFRQPTVQRTFNVSKFDRITQIRALDQKGNGKGGTARLIKGGPGLSSATLFFKSQKGGSINFIVELYARH